MTGVGRFVSLRPGQGTKVRIGADRFATKGDPAHRSEAFSVIEYEGAPGMPGPPPHVHRTFEEAWYILEGEVQFTSGGRSISAKTGAYLFVPRGTPHAFQVKGRRPARWIGIFSPARYVKLLEELGALIPAAGPPDPAAIGRLFAKYDTEIVRPD